MRYVTIIIRQLDGVKASARVQQDEFEFRSDFEAVAVGGLLAEVFEPEDEFHGILSIALREEGQGLRREDTRVWILSGNIEESVPLDRMADEIVGWMGWQNDLLPLAQS